MQENIHIENAKVFKAFCDDKRLMILEMLQTGEKCQCELLEHLNIKQSTLSHHTKIMYEAGIINCRKDGKWVYYFIDPAGCEKAISLLHKLTALNESNQTHPDCK